jgi:outer membrane protein
MQLLSDTLEKYGISIVNAATGAGGQAPVIPGLTSPKPPEAPKPISVTPNAPPQ